MHPKARREANLRPAGAELERRHSPQASSAISSQVRLSNSSMGLRTTGIGTEKNCRCLSFSEVQNPSQRDPRAFE